MEERCGSSSSSGRVKSGANQRDWSSSRSRNGDCTPVCSRWPSQLWSSNGDISRELRAAWQRQTGNGVAYNISNGTRRAPKQALRLRFCEELCSGKLQHDGEMTETQMARTGRKTRCHPGKHPGMLHIVTRDRGGRDDVMRKSPIAQQKHPTHMSASLSFFLFPCSRLAIAAVELDCARMLNSDQCRQVNHWMILDKSLSVASSSTNCRRRPGRSSQLERYTSHLPGAKWYDAVQWECADEHWRPRS